MSDETVDNWNKVDFPVMSTSPYDLSSTNYYISVGLFNYDTTLLQTYAPGEYERYFASGAYDGWSMGSVMYFEFYKFTNDSQSFGACMSNGYCWGSWLIYDSDQSEYYSYYIGFVYANPVTTIKPDVGAAYTAAYVYEYYNSLHTFYMPDYTWYYLGSTGALFFKWMPAQDANRPKIGD